MAFRSRHTPPGALILPRNPSSDATLTPNPPPQTMESTPPPVIGKSGNLTVFITPPATPSPSSDTARSCSPESPRSEFSTPSATPRAEASLPASPPPPEEPATSPQQLKMPPLVKTVSPPLPAAKMSQPPPVQVPPPQFGKAGARSDGSAFAFFWHAVARVQEAHASLDDYISNWFGLDQSKYQWALNDYYEITGKETDSGKAGKPKDLNSKMQKV